jgi:DNA-binding NarL/FixJ family response regulator
MIKIVLIEDCKLIRENWQLYFNNHAAIHLLEAYENIKDAIFEGLLEHTDLLVLDLNLSGINSKDYIKKFLVKYPKLKIMIFTISNNHQDIFESIQNGAITYLTKDTAPKKITESIQETYNGGSVISPEIAKILVQAFQKKSKKIIELNDREETILIQLANGNSYKEIAEKLCLSNHGIDYHIRKIYDKLQVRSRNQAVKVALKENLLSKFF